MTLTAEKIPACEGATPKVVKIGADEAQTTSQWLLRLAEKFQALMHHAANLLPHCCSERDEGHEVERVVQKDCVFPQSSS